MSTSLTSPRQRLEWADMLKAFLIFMVLTEHISYFSFGNTDVSNCISKLTTYYFMPAFFFVSGMFAKSTNDIRKNVLRLLRLGIPFIICGGLYAWYRYPNTPLSSSLSLLFSTRMHLGYWFIYTLLFINIIFIGRNAVVARMRFLPSFSVDISLLGICILLSLLSARRLTPSEQAVFSLDHLKSAPLFYFMGFWYMKYLIRQNKVLNTLIIECSVIGLIAVYGFRLLTDVHGVGITLYACNVLQALFSIVILLKLFQTIPDKFSRISYLRYVGTHTLEIYVLHYFLIPHHAADIFGVFQHLHPVWSYGMYMLLALPLLFLTTFLIMLAERSVLLRALLFGDLGKWGR